MSEKRILTFRLKRKWWEQIASGHKTEELRAATDYWRKRLIGCEYDEIHLWMGYPKKTETEKLIRRKWNGVTERVVTHEEFGPGPVSIIAVDLNLEAED